MFHEIAAELLELTDLGFETLPYRATEIFPETLQNEFSGTRAKSLSLFLFSICILISIRADDKLSFILSEISFVVWLVDSSQIEFKSLTTDASNSTISLEICSMVTYRLDSCAVTDRERHVYQRQ